LISKNIDSFFNRGAMHHNARTNVAKLTHHR
jgi:hypothetical protein